MTEAEAEKARQDAETRKDVMFMMGLMLTICIIVSLIMVCGPSVYFYGLILILTDFHCLDAWCSLRPRMARVEERQFRSPETFRGAQRALINFYDADLIANYTHSPVAHASMSYDMYADIPISNTTPPYRRLPFIEQLQLQLNWANFASTDVKLQSSLSMTVVVPKKC